MQGLPGGVGQQVHEFWLAHLASRLLALKFPFLHLCLFVTDCVLCDVGEVLLDFCEDWLHLVGASGAPGYEGPMIKYSARSNFQCYVFLLIFGEQGFEGLV